MRRNIAATYWSHDWRKGLEQTPRFNRVALQLLVKHVHLLNVVLPGAQINNLFFNSEAYKGILDLFS